MWELVLGFERVCCLLLLLVYILILFTYTVSELFAMNFYFINNFEYYIKASLSSNLN